MAIYLPSSAEEEQLALDELTPREIVVELDKHVIGQKDAKRAVAIALRNRMRRQKLTPELAEEIMPKNILMIGPTGIGKTEIARRLAKLANSPFLKVEASKFTEVGYVGRDVESMVRDLVEIAIDNVREEKLEDVADKAELNAEERLLDILLPPSPPSRPVEPTTAGGVVIDGSTALAESSSRTREKLRQQLREGKLDDRQVEIDVRERNFPSFEIMTNQGVEEMDINIKDMLPSIFGQRTKKRKMKVNEAFEYLIQEEEQRLIDMDQVTRMAIDRVENSGIVFLDEIDKIAGREGGHGPDVSREGVQRDILPIVEGTTVNTRYGMVRTDHILFIAAGAFHVSKPSDLIPELQGRFPDPRGVAVPDHGRLRPHSYRAEIFPGEAVHRFAGDRRRKAGVHSRIPAGNRALRVSREREHGKHWSAASAYHYGARARCAELRRSREKRRARDHRRRLCPEDAK